MDTGRSLPLRLPYLAWPGGGHSLSAGRGQGTESWVRSAGPTPRSDSPRRTAAHKGNPLHPRQAQELPVPTPNPPAQGTTGKHPPKCSQRGNSGPGSCTSKSHRLSLGTHPEQAEQRSWLRESITQAQTLLGLTQQNCYWARGPWGRASRLGEGIPTVPRSPGLGTRPGSKRTISRSRELLNPSASPDISGKGVMG